MTENEKIIPFHWIYSKLGEVCQTTSGGTPSRKNSLFYEGNIPWVKSGELNYNTILETEEHISEDAIKKSSAKVFPKGTLLIALYGATIGKLAILGIDAATNQAVCAIFKNGIFESKFLYHLLFHKRQDLVKEGIGGAQPNISQTILKNLEVPICPLPEQRAIVSKIEQLFSELDNGIANLKLAQEQLKVYRQAVLKKAFEGDWNTVELQVISNAVGGFAFKSKDFKDDGKYQIIRIGNIQPGNLRLDKSPVFVDNIETKIIDKYLLKQGDVVITLTGTRKKRDYGFTSLVNQENLLLNQRIAFLRFNNKCLPKFFLYYSWTEPFKNEFFASETGNVGQGNVGMKAIQSTVIPLPSIPEQQAIVQEIETRLSVCDKIEQDIKENLEKAEALRQSILKKAFEGKLLNERELAEVRGAEDWEPAEVLLERIRAGKARK